jgi:hypothetical protein
MENKEKLFNEVSKMAPITPQTNFEWFLNDKTVFVPYSNKEQTEYVRKQFTDLYKDILL